MPLKGVLVVSKALAIQALQVYQRVLHHTHVVIPTVCIRVKQARIVTLRALIQLIMI